MGKIIVRGLKSYAYHGCLESEKKIGGHYETTVWVEGDFSKAEVKDLLNFRDHCSRANEEIV